MSARDQAKLLLGAIASLQRDLQAADECWTEIDKLGGILSVRRAEFADAEALLKNTRAAVAEATTRLEETQATATKEEKRIAARIDPLKRELLDLEKQVAEKRLESDSVTAGIAALHKRLSLGT